MAQMATISKYLMRALGTAAPNSNTINIILHNNSYLPAVQWQQICTSPNCTSPNGNKYVQAQMAQSVQAQMATNMYKPK